MLRIEKKNIYSLRKSIPWKKIYVAIGCKVSQNQITVFFFLVGLSIIIHIIVLLIFFHSFRHFPSFTSILLLFYYRFLLYIYSFYNVLQVFADFCSKLEKIKYYYNKILIYDNIHLYILLSNYSA